MKNESNGQTGEIKFTPLWDYVLMEPIKKNVTKGGIQLPDGTQMDDTSASIVRKVGPGAIYEGVYVPNPVKVGDTVYHVARQMPFKITLDGKLFLCASARDIVGIS